MLHVNQLSKHFGGLTALDNVSLSVGESEIVGLIGPNGSGKTTLFNLITKVILPSGGEIRFEGRDLNRLRSDQICRLGIARTHQIPRPFKNLTVRENVVFAHLYGTGGKKQRHEAEEISLRLLALVGLQELAQSPASQLNDVQCKILELARCLATEPKLLLLDEILAGLTPSELLTFRKLILRIRDEMGIVIFWCEHIMKALMSTADRVICLHHGRKICEGAPEEVANDEQVISCYLGDPERCEPC